MTRAKFLNSLGIAAFALKYRLAREENSPYSLDKHPREDGERAMRLVRSRAAEWGIDPNRVGMMGFSAGGEVVSMVAFNGTTADQQAADPIDRQSARPNFLIQIYPGPLGIPKKVEKTLRRAFLLVANDDPCCSDGTIQLLQRYHEAKAQVEAHVFAQGSHGFNMGQRSKLKSVNTWPQRLADWLSDTGILTGKSSREAGLSYAALKCRLRITGRFCENAERAITMSHPASWACCFSSPWTCETYPSRLTSFVSGSALSF